jgi:hypothetical protein
MHLFQLLACMILKCKIFKNFQERRIRNFSIHIRRNFYFLQLLFYGSNKNSASAVWRTFVYIFTSAAYVGTRENHSTIQREIHSMILTSLI